MNRFLVTLLLGLAAILTGCSDETGRPDVWRFALEEVEGSVQHAYAKRFKALVEARTDGAVSVQIYPYGALGSSMDLTEQLRAGALQFAFASPGHLGTLVPEVQIFNLHFLMPENEALLHRLLADSEPLHRLLNQSYESKRLRLLAIIPEGWMVWTGNRPLRQPADFRGFKIRTMASPLSLAAYEAYGANPTPMPYSEVYSALQLKMIDGQVNPVFAIEEMSFYEVQSHMSFARHLPFIATVLVNPTFHDALAPQQRAMLRDIKSSLDDYIFEYQKRLNQRRLETIRNNSDIEMIEVSEADRQAFRRLSLPVREKYVGHAGERGRELLNTIDEEVARLKDRAQGSDGS